MRKANASRMQVAASQSYYADAGKFPHPMSSGPYMVPQACVPPQGVTWVQQYVNGTPMLVPMYPVAPAPPMPYYQAPVYYNTNTSNSPASRQPISYDNYQQQQHVPAGQQSFAQPLSNARQPILNNSHNSKRTISTTSSVFSGSSFLPSLDENCVNMHKSHVINTPFRPSKREIMRYESADSGIAESPPSVTSPTWSGDDLSSLDSDDARRTSDSSDSYKDLDEDSHYWSVADDQQYWARQGQKQPNPFVCAAIAKQVDYYLSDDYLIKDKYLLRQIRCKKDGYVSIKLITSFKKVKKLTRDWQVVRSAIARNSHSIVVSPEGLRIRRRAKLSDNLRKPRLLTSVLVIRLPEDYNSVQKVTSLFRNFGEISFVRLLRADKEVPADLRNYATQVHDIGATLCGVIDFECSEDALNAVRVVKHFQKQNEVPSDERRDGQDDGTECDGSFAEKYNAILQDLPPLGDLRLALLGPRVRRTLYRQDRVSESSEHPDQDPSSPSSTSSDIQQQNNEERMKTLDLDTVERRRRLSADDTMTSRSHGNEIVNRRHHGVSSDEFSRSLPKNFGASCSWVTQRRSAALSGLVGPATPPFHALRAPKGPDGTPGFKFRRNL